MKTLNNIIENEKKDHQIETWAKNLGFQNVCYVFEKPSQFVSPSLVLIADVNYDMGGNSNYTHLLENKLKEQLGIKVSVLINSKVKDIYKKGINNNCISINADIKDINHKITACECDPNLPLQAAENTDASNRLSLEKALKKISEAQGKTENFMNINKPSPLENKSKFQSLFFNTNEEVKNEEMCKDEKAEDAEGKTNPKHEECDDDNELRYTEKTSQF